MLSIWMCHGGGQNPMKILLSEVYTQGQSFIELTTTSLESEVSLDKYSIAIITQDASKEENLRALMDLRRHKFKNGNKFGVVGNFPSQYPNKLLDPELPPWNDVLINKAFQRFNFLSVGKRQYLIIALIYADDYLSDKYVWKANEKNELTNDVLEYIKTNLVDLLIVKGVEASQRCKSLGERWQDSIGYSKIKPITNPATAQLKHQILSLSSCPILNEPFDFDSWEGNRPTPGEENKHCPSQVGTIPTPTCENLNDCSDQAAATAASNDDDVFECEKQFSEQVRQNINAAETMKRPGKNSIRT